MIEQPQWVRTADKKPKEVQTVLLVAHDVIMYGFYFPEHDEWTAVDSPTREEEIIKGKHVTHWMELPPLPQEIMDERLAFKLEMMKKIYPADMKLPEVIDE